jgi:uncharacterized lipoprotein YddW (UPF0748 family)
MRRLPLFALLAAAVLIGCKSQQSPPPPPAAREFRAAWVATVANIDWPSKPGLPAEQQRREAIAILDRCHTLNLNAVIFQVRTSCDALYASPYEPWSYYLTGQQGKAPDDGYDPLQFWVDEAHKRGLELHAWFNPYRAKQVDAAYELAPSHVAKRSPNLVKKYGPTMLWLDPGEPAAADQTLQVMADVVRRYDVDGIHIDDYFYPYPINDKAGKPIDFPDDPSWKRYQQSGGKLARDDWRRDNINRLVQRMYSETKQLKPWVKVGISPFGIWRPGNPPSVQGFDAYAKLYADSKVWLQQGWVDYWTPQIYWRLHDPPKPPYEDLLRWWVEQNTQKRNLWPGLYTSMVATPATQPSTAPTKPATRRAATRPATTTAARAPWAAQDLLDQLAVNRRTDGVTGEVHFSMKCLMEDRQHVDEALYRQYYAEPALVPASPWLAGGAKAPASPRFAVGRAANGLQVEWKPDASAPQWLWVVHVQYASGWRAQVFPAATRSAAFAADPRLGPPQRATVTAVDRFGIESKPATGISPK